jgi:hypothetical protein
MDVLLLAKHYDIINNVVELKTDDVNLLDKFLKFISEILNKVKEEDKNKEFKELKLLDFILILQKLAYIKLRKELENELDEIIDIKEIKGKLYEDVAIVKKNVKELLKKYIDDVLEGRITKEEEEEEEEE